MREPSAYCFAVFTPQAGSNSHCVSSQVAPPSRVVKPCVLRPAESKPDKIG